MHGFAILDWIRESTRQDLLVEDGALYHALRRMEEPGVAGELTGACRRRGGGPATTG